MISVIVPIYNVYAFLGDCIESICNQTYKDLEIILVDDGSTDNSGTLCDNYMRIDPRIRVIHQENQGLSAARNTGIEQAKGEFLVFVDSDDRVHRMMIQILYDAMRKNDAEIVICSHRKIQGTEPKGLSSLKTNSRKKTAETLSGRECIKRMYEAQIDAEQKIDMTVAWNKLYKKSMFYDVRYPIGRLHEDEFVTYRILYNLTKCLYLKMPLYEYRLREGSIMRGESVDRLKDKMDAFEERCIYFEQKGDMELYFETLRRYETCIAEFILFLEEKQIEEKLLRRLIARFQLVYREKIAVSEMPFQHKLKYMLFMKNRSIYKFLKRITNKNTWKKKNGMYSD